MKMWLLLPLILLTGGALCEQKEQEKEPPISSDSLYLNYPSSYANFTSDTWKLTESEHQLILGVSFKAETHVGQIFSIRFIHPDGKLKALLTAGVSEGILKVDLYNEKHEKILNKPMENVPINIHMHSMALGINTTSQKVWFQLGHQPTLTSDINQPLDISNCVVVVTLGGGGQSMIGCISLLAVSVGERPPGKMETTIDASDIGACPAADECTSRNCNTGRCKLLEVPVCDCYGTEMSGPNCRTPGTTIQLRNNDENEETSAFLRYTPWQPDQKVSRITMDFKFSDVDAKEGILVYGETMMRQIFKIYVVGAKGKMMLDKENIMDFELSADDSQFHTIILRLEDYMIQLYVDGSVQKAQFNQTLLFNTIQFGAPIPTDVGVSEVGVTACVKNIYVDHNDILDLVASANDSRVVSSKVRPCEDEDLTNIAGVKMFSADAVVVITVEPEKSDDENEEPQPIAANLFPVPANKKKPRPQSTSSCEKPNAYKCLNGADCKKEINNDFTCFCRDGYIGKFCQFTTLPKSCAEAYDFLKLPNGPTWVDVDGNGRMVPSVASCQNGVTQIPHNMSPTTVVRDAGFQNHSLFVLSYRDFNTWQLAKYMKNSGRCSQSVNYRCNKAPLKFEEGKTWFKSVTNVTKRIRQIGRLEYSCPCLDVGCQSGEKCNCDSGSISEDVGELTGNNAGVSEIVTLFDEADVRAEMTISELKCSGYESEKPIRFTRKVGIQAANWTGESIDFHFRTSDAPARLVTVNGNYGEKIITVSLLDGHTVQINNLEAVKIIGSQNKLNDSEWHHVLIELAEGEIRVTVDAAHVLMTIMESANLEGSVEISGNGDGFIGCVRNLIINGSSVDLQEYTSTDGILSSCDSACTTNLCQNGAKCYEDFATMQPFCRCAFPDVHSGANCEIDMNANSSVSFHGGHLKFDNLSTVLMSSVYFSFRSDKTHALLFFAHDQNNNFLQVHLSEEVNLTLTLNNLDIVSQCTVRAQPGTEFGDMRWIQVAITHDATSSQLQVDEAACTIRKERLLSTDPIKSLRNVFNAEIVRPPVGNAAPIKPDPYTITFVGDVDTGSKTNDGSIMLQPKYDSPIPRFYGCIRGFLVDGQLLDMRKKAEELATSEMYDAYGLAQVHAGCETGCSKLTCSNGGHCSVAWTNTDPTADKTTCDCSRTSYAGFNCTKDEGIHLERNGFLDFNISAEMERIYVDKRGKTPQILKFAFSVSPRDQDQNQDENEDKAVLASVTFKERRKLEIEINPNRTINVAISYENGKSEVLNFPGDFTDGYRHFVVVQTNQESATAVMVDSLRQDFEYRGYGRNIDMFSATNVKIGDHYSEIEGYIKNGVEGCISNFDIDYQRGAALIYTPIAYFNTPSHHHHRLLSWKKDKITSGSCAEFEVPNSLPVYQNRVKFPAWETDFKRFIYHGDVENEKGADDGEDQWTSEDSGSLLWILIIIIILVLVFLIIFCIFMKCCRERIHARDSYPHDEDIPLNLTPTIMRHPQPSPPPQKQSAASNYRIPNPNVDFNKGSRATSITSSGISGYFTAQENVYEDEDEDETVRMRDGTDDSDNETIRHIDDEMQEEDGMVVVSRPTQVNHLPQRVSSFRSGDPTAPIDSPLYAQPRKAVQPVPVPPPRITPGYS